MFCNGFGPAGQGFGFLMMISFVLVFIMAFYFIYRLVNIKSLGYDTSYSKAMSVLNERFASGHISEEEYKMKKREILK